MTLARKPGEDIARWVKRFNLRRIRLEKGWSVEELANQYTCLRDYIYQLEGGLVGIGPRSLKKLAGILQVDPIEFMRHPPELGSKELDEIYGKLVQAHLNTNHLHLFNDILELILMAAGHEHREEVLMHLERQLHLLKRIFQPSKK